MSQISKVIVETFGSIKEIITAKKEIIYEALNKATKDKFDIKFSTINEIPKYFIEFFAVIGFFLLGYDEFKNNDNETLLVSLILRIIIQIITSVSRILTVYNKSIL